MRFHAKARSNYNERTQAEVVKAERKKDFEESAGSGALERKRRLLPGLKEMIGVFAARHCHLTEVLGYRPEARG